jgi:tRNA(Ile)-lysidine synthase
MNNFTDIVIKKFFDAIDRNFMLFCVDEVVIGFSGGADSVCLMDLFYKNKEKLGVSIIAAHVDHGIRGEEAQRDCDFVKQFCEERDIPIKTLKVNCIEEAKKNKEGVEECGRRIRYEFFESLRNECAAVVTAHNANDNAETLLFNLARGTSVRGACGISATRNNIIRPIIYCTREEIEGYCKENSLQYVVDSTNLSDDYTRNKIRHNIIPVMEQVNSAAIKNITAFCNDMSDVMDFLDKQADAVFCKARAGINVYKYDPVFYADPAVQKRLILLMYQNFTSSNATLDRKKIESIVNLLYGSGRMQLFGDEWVEVTKKEIRFFINKPKESYPVQHVFVGESYRQGDFSICVELVSYDKELDPGINTDTLLDNLIDCDKIVGNVYLRGREAGDKIKPYARNVTKSLKKLFNEMNIPIELRDSIPVLCDDEGIIWVYGVGAVARTHISESSSNIIYVRGENNDW